MSSPGARSLGDRDRDARTNGMTPAQWYCLLAGGALLLAGLFGFIADAKFDTGDGVDGGKLIALEVNGWHNVVHVASGLLLLAAFRKRTSAKTIALLFGIVYGAVALIGLIDGSDVLGFIPVNPADNILHIALSLAGILASLASPREEPLRTSTDPATADGRTHTPTTTTDRDVHATTNGQDTRFDRKLDSPDRNPRDRGEQPTNR